MIRLYLFYHPEQSRRKERILAACRKWQQEREPEGQEFDPEEWIPAREESGRPYFPYQRGTFLSISDSGGYWAVALSDRPVGMDLQINVLRGARDLKEQDRRIGSLLRHLNGKEADYIAAGVSGEDRSARFFQVWCAKEACVKYTGEGIGASFRLFSVCSAGQIAETCALADGRAVSIVFHPSSPGYSLCTASEEVDSDFRCVLMSGHTDRAAAGGQRPTVRCVALDLDRTTLRTSDSISDGNRRALERAISRNITVVIASGRTVTALPAAVTEIPGIRYAITSNGALLSDLETGQILRKCCHDPENVEGILRATAGMDVAYEVFVDGQAYAPYAYLKTPERYGLSPQYVHYVESTRVLLTDITGFIREHRAEILGLDIMTGDPVLYRQIQDRLRREVPHIYMTSSVSNRIETSSEHAGKGAALLELIAGLGIRPQETAAFGDADNDVDLLGAAGCGIAVGNASAACKKAASFETLPCNDDGVAAAFEHLLGI